MTEEVRSMGSETARSARKRPRLCALALAALVAAAGVAAALFREDMELALMRLARDLSRAKSRRRAMGKEGSLAEIGKVLAGWESHKVELQENGVEVTQEELAGFDGTDPNLPLYLAIKGRVYDVSEGKEYYGPGRSYHHFVGRDATRAFCTGCHRPECLVSSLIGLDEVLKLEADRWLELYELHDKYKYIGRLVEDPVDKALKQAELEESLLLDEKRKPLKPSKLKELGILAYQSGDLEDASFYFRSGLVSLGEHSSAAENRDKLSRREVLRVELLNLMATVAQRQKSHNFAIDHYQEALDILAKLLSKDAYKRSVVRANILADQAAALFKIGNLEKATNGFKQAKEILQRSRHSEGKRTGAIEAQLANTLLNFAFCLKESKALNLAIVELQSLLDLANEMLANGDLRFEDFKTAANEGLKDLDKSKEKSKKVSISEE